MEGHERQDTQEQSMAQTILIAEDNRDIRDLLKMYLESEGFRIVTADNGKTALGMAENEMPDLAILDIMMPEMDGFELTRMLRRKSSIPILILSARSLDTDKILGLNLGADDYIAKPFNPLEIAARVKALLRRAGTVNGVNGEWITEGNLSLNISSCTLLRDGELIPLTPMEYKILYTLMRSPGRIFTRVQIYEAINGEYFENDDNTMMVHISRLRDKIEDDPKRPSRIVTVRGLGYKFEKRKA